MSERKPTVDAYIAGAAPFAQPILQHLRELVHASCPVTREAIKWSMPFFLYGEKPLCNMAAFRSHCAFGFWDRRMSPLLAERGVMCGTAMGSLGRLRDVTDLPGDATLLALLESTYALAREPSPGRMGIARPPRPEIAPPPELVRELAARAGAAERFAGLSASCRREYAEWVESAKRDETRARRATEAAARIADGRTRP